MFNRFLLKLTLISFSSLIGIFNSQNSASAAFFMGIGDLPGGDFSSAANRVSEDGSVVGGISVSESGLQGEAFLWRAETGIVPLGDLPGGMFLSGVFGVSDDGLVAAGASISETSSLSNPPLESFRWTLETGMVPLGDLPGGQFSSFTLNVSGDGLVVVGDSDSASGREAFRWTEATGMVGLGDFAGGPFRSGAVNTSFDGSVIVGNGVNAVGVEGFRWTEATGLVGIGDLPGGEIFSNATSVSNDGLVVVGRSASENSSDVPLTEDGGAEAFRWTEETGLIGLGDLPGGIFSSRAIAVSGDGSVIVGQGNGASGEEPFIWDSLNGMRSLIQVLTNEFGLDLTGWSSLTVADLSADGSTVVGLGINPEGNLEGWIANLESEATQVPEPTPIGGILALLGVASANSLLKKLATKC